jgi:tRNA(Ile)-lysidine synthase
VRTAEAKAVSASEVISLFSGLQSLPVLVLAVSGGPDSTALMVLAAQWRDSLRTKPKLVAVTIDHGLRKESKAEAATVARLARRLDIAHRTSRWTGRKPKTGLQEAARLTRYRLLGNAARRAGGTHILTAHTLDDQSETVLIRMSRGSGISGLGAMQRISSVPHDESLFLVRPLLDISKRRLIATLRAEGISYTDDPSNRDPRFTRARLRALMHMLAEEGLDAAQLARLARRLKRADVAIERAVERAVAELFVELHGAPAIAIEARRFADLPAEVALRLLGRAIARVGIEGPVELGKLEALKTVLDEAQNSPKNHFRRTLAGAIVTLKDPQILVERAPPRRRKVLTKRRPGRSNSAKRR